MSSILDAFYILFEGDASQLKKEAEKAKKSTEDFNETVKDTEENSRKVNKSFNGVAESISKIAAAYMSFNFVKEGIRDAAEFNAELEFQSKILGIDADELSVWGNAVESAGGNANAFIGFLSRLNDQYSQMGMGDRVPQIPEILPRVADMFSGLTRGQALRAGKFMGLDEGTIVLLMKGRDAVQEVIDRQRELVRLTKMDAEISREFQTETNNLSIAFRSLFTSLGEDTLPVISWFLRKVQDVVIYLRENKSLVYGFFAGLAIAVGIVAAPIILVTAKVLALVAVLGAIGAVVGLAFEDLYNWITGADSKIGSLIGSFEDFKQLLIDIADVITNTFTKAFDDASNAADAIWKNAKGLFGFDDGGLSSAQGQLAMATSSPIGATSSTSISNMNMGGGKSVKVETGPITINSQATDAEGVAKDIGIYIDTEIRNATMYFDDGIDR